MNLDALLLEVERKLSGQDHNMPNLESEIRHLLYTKRYLPELLGVAEHSLNIDFEPDTFGHNGRWPDVAGAAGVKYFYHCRGERIEGLYRWRGQSGHELLAFCEPDWYCAPTLHDEIVQRVPDFCEKFGMPAMQSDLAGGLRHGARMDGVSCPPHCTGRGPILHFAPGGNLWRAFCHSAT